MRVRELMTTDPFTVDPDAPLGTAIALMRMKEIRHLPVVDEARRLVGIITDRDLRQAAFGPALAEHLSFGAQRRLRGLARDLGELRVRDAMTWVVATVHPDAAIAHAALVMFERRVGSLPVVEDGKLVGILTERDLLKALLKESPAIRLGPEDFLW